MKRNALKRVLASTLCALMVVGLSACGTSSSKKTEQNTNQQTQEQASIQPGVPTNKIHASIKDITVKPLHFYGINVDEMDNGSGFVIEAHAVNQENASVNIYPKVVATVNDKDDYGDDRTRSIILTCGSVTTPYGSNHYGNPDKYEEYLPSIGLAPKEEKNVRYYIHGSARGYDMQSKSHTYLSGGDTYFDANTATITDIKLVDVAAEKTKNIEYIANKDWGKQVNVKAVDLSIPGLPILGKILTGSFENNTDKRWQDATIVMDVMVDNQGFTAPVRASTTKIGIGKTFFFRKPDAGEYRASELFIEYNNNNHQIDVYPAVMYYTPESTSD